MRRVLRLPLVLLWTALALFAVPALAADQAGGAQDKPMSGQSGKEINALAEAGDAEAQFERGKFLVGVARGGHPEVMAEALTWLRKSADQGHVGAAYFTGYIYYSGAGTPQDYALAQKYLNAAAAKGNSSAMFTLGHMYLRGEGVEQNHAKAAEWYTKAAEKGSDNAQTSLAILYAEGLGVPKDGAKAVELARKAIAQGNAGAMYNLGIMYAKGEAVPLHPAKAVYWLRMAASKGYYPAAAALGRYYYTGLGSMKRDPFWAAVWLQAALEMNRNSRETFDLFFKLSPTLTAEQARGAKDELARWDEKGIPAPPGPEPN